MTTPPDAEPVKLGQETALQGLVPGVAPLDPTKAALAALERSRAARRGSAPLPAGGLFDEVAKAQQDLF